MAGVQQDNKIFPHVVPGPPDAEDQLLDWAKDISVALQDLTRQTVDKFNLHIDNSQSHYKAWETSKRIKPWFRSNISDTSQVVLPASATAPVYFVIGETLFEITSDLTLDLDISGVGGLRTGLSKAANTIYYLYAVKSSDTVALIGDTTGPLTGLTGYTDWTYIGSFATIAGSAVAQFMSSGGRYISSASLNTVSHTGDTTISGQTLFAPETAKFSIGDILVDGVTAGTVALVSGFNDTNNMTIRQALQVNGITNSNEAVVAVVNPTLIYLKVNNAGTTATWRVHGWIENPWDYK